MTTVDTRLVLEHMSEGFLAVSADWRVRESNSAAETLLQRGADAMKGATLAEIIPDLDASPGASGLRRVAEGRVARRIEHFAPSRYTWFELYAVPQGDGLYLFLRNVTDRVRQMQTEAVRAAVRAIVMDAPVAISITRGPEHRYDLNNHRARQLVGNRDLEGSIIRNAFPELAGSPLFDTMDTVYRTGEPFTGRNIGVRYDKAGDGVLTDAVFDITYQPLFEPDGRVWGLLIVAVEVTEYAAIRTQLEEAAKLDA